MSSILDFTVNLAVVTSGNMDSSFTKAGAAMSELQKRTQNLQNISGQVSKYQKMQTSLDASKTKLDQARMKVKTMAEEMKRTAQPTQAMKDAFTRANEKVRDALKTVQDQRRALGELGQSLREAGVNTSDFEGTQKNLVAQLGRVKEAQDRLSAAQDKYAQITNGLSWGNMKNDVLTSMASLQAFKVPVQVDMQFEQAMANVRAVNGANDEDFAMLRNQSMELGASTMFSATQAANTQEALARGGFDPKQIIAAMPAVLDMAAAEGMDLAAAGDIIVKTLGGMGFKDANGNIDATQSQRVADVLANMSASSATNITELGEGMKIAAPVMSQLGVTIEQLGAYLGGMANKGFTGSEAGNALASTAMRLNKLPSEAKKALGDLGVATKTRDGKMRELPDLMKAINEAFGKRKIGEADRIDYLARIFGQGHGKAMLGFMDASVAGQMDTLQASNENNAKGASARMAGVRNDTLQGDITALGSAWEGLMIQIGHALEPVNRFITQTLTEGISKVTQFMREHETLCSWIVRIAAGLAAWKTISTVFRYGALLCQLPFAKLSVTLAQGAANAALTGEKFSAVGSVFKGLMSPVKALWGVIAAHPFVAIGAAAVALGTLIYQNWDSIKEYASAAWNSIKSFAGGAADWVKGVWQGVSDWWNSWSLADIFGSIELPDFSGITETFSSVRTTVTEAFSSIDFSGVTEAFSTVRTDITEFFSAIDFSSATETFSSVASGISTTMIEAFGGASSWISESFSNVSSTVSGIFVGVSTTVTEAFRSIDFETVSARVSGTFASIRSTVTEAFSAINISGITETFSTITSAVSNVFSMDTLSSIGKNITESFSTIDFEGIRSKFSDTWEAISGSETFNAVKTAITNTFSLETFSAIGRNITESFSTIDFEGIRAGFSSAFSTVTEAFRSINIEGIKSSFSTIAVSLSEGFRNINIETVISSLAGIREKLFAPFTAFADWLEILQLPDIFAPLASYAQNVIALITRPFDTLKEWFASWTMPDIFASMSDTALNAIESIKGLFSGLGTWIMDTIGKLNPFNWEMPSWLGGGSKATPEQAEAGKASAKAKFGTQDLRPSYMKHARGGIMTSPHLGLVAEEGAEAIIPLTDKSRGIEVLMQAANILGVQGSIIPSIAEGGIPESSGAFGAITDSLSAKAGDSDLYSSAMNLAEGSSSSSSSISSQNNSFAGGSPIINITVNASEGEDNAGLADMIARKVSEAWQELQERQERLAFA